MERTTEKRSAELPAVVVMARYWATGAVKTRLAKEVGEGAARDIYRDLARKVWLGLRDPDLDRFLCITPTEACEAAGRWLPGAKAVVPQRGRDLGARMETALRQVFELRAPWCAVVGTDAPEIDAKKVKEAGRALEHKEVAIVPSVDGGYALLALERPHPELFSGIRWGSDEVLTATLSRASELNLSVELLSPVMDLDTASDLEELRRRGLL